MNNKKQYDTNVFDMNNIGSIQCVAVAKTEKAKDDLLKRAYMVLFSPEENDINCWVLCREESEVLIEYYGAAEPPVRCGESHLSGLTEPPHFVY